MRVVTIETPQLGDRSYLVHDGESALVIDAQRDIDRVLLAVEKEGVQVTHVAETHVHNDYVTGGYALARQTGAELLVNADDPVDYERRGISDGDEIAVGTLTVTVVATPGHTHTHLSYVVTHGDEQAVFSGGSLLFGSVGRTDLVAPEDTGALTHGHSTRPCAGSRTQPGMMRGCSRRTVSARSAPRVRRRERRCLPSGISCSRTMR